MASCEDLGIEMLIVYSPRRVNCPACGIKVEKIPWSMGKSSLSMPLIDTLQRMAKYFSFNDVARLFGVSWNTVRAAVQVVSDIPAPADVTILLKNLAKNKYTSDSLATIKMTRPICHSEVVPRRDTPEESVLPAAVFRLLPERLTINNRRRPRN